ncbi:hypothetical protein Goshw_006003 [Gossypium schwendimanii]|uniref:Uncharacterized protein n=1 Tax=Gossypium schwendimanii TaxID=34291 RepID=A0A7J9MGL3_GOSSC|nr:hypothetical protein [Gossypium schwendimanii]
MNSIEDGLHSKPSTFKKHICQHIFCTWKIIN